MSDKIKLSKVYHGEVKRSAGGLKAGDITRVCDGGKCKYVSTKKRANGLANPWARSVSAARRKLRVLPGEIVLLEKPKGNSPTTAGQRLYVAAKQIYNSNRIPNLPGVRRRSLSRGAKAVRKRSLSRGAKKVTEVCALITRK